MPATGQSLDEPATPEAGGGGPATPDGAEAAVPAPRRRRRWLRITLILVLVLVVLVAGLAIASTYYYKSVSKEVARVDAFSAIPEAARPTKDAVAKNAMNFLVLGSDTRDPENTGGSRSDTIIVLHLTKDHSAAQMVSIPRDTWVHVPRSADGQHGNVNAKINAAYAWGGVPLTVQTVENYTGIRIDHVAMVDFAGFKEIVDALGGVQITVEKSFTSTHSLNKSSIRKFEAGTQTMDGAAALDYARERYSFADGDFARIRHQQDVIKAVLDKASSGGVLSNPAKVNDFLRATSGAVGVDKTLNILDMALDLRHLRSGNLAFYTSPSSGTGMIGGQSVVLPDKTKAKKLFDAIRKDDPAAAAGVVAAN
jgi:LCP family protein required for cell wall assembly